MNTHSNRWLRLAARALALTVVWMAQNVTSAVKENFGYNHMKVNGQEARGHRPLLVIRVNFATAPAFAHPDSYYDDLVFNFFNTNSVNGYCLENSNSRFYWERAGSGMISLDRPATERFTNWLAIAKAANITDVHWPEYAWFSNVVAQAMISGRFDFSPYARDGVTVREGDLGIIIINNDHEPSKDGLGANRPTLRVKQGGSTVAVEMREPGGATGFADNTTFNVGDHEACHLLGTVDLYGSGSLSGNLSLMAGNTDGGAGIYHLDPWHKMQLSWSEPRIGSLREGGKAVLPAAQLTQPDGPVILYDPLGDTNEFFMLEYRTPSSPLGSGFDRNVAGSGLVIWHIRQTLSKDPVLLKDLAHGPFPGQGNWWWCKKCQGLTFAISPSFGPCPAGGSHTNLDSGYYSMVSAPAAPGQHHWRWCHKCQGLFFGDNASSSVCPATGLHEGTTSSDYSLVADSLDAAGQPGWRWCHKCQGLFFGGNESSSVCPAGGRHEHTGSGDYRMVANSPDAYAVFTEGAPDLQRGGNRVWGSGVTTPNLRWLDTTEMPVKLHVHPFSPGDGSITVEWLRDETTWVDFAYFGFFEFGAFVFPYNTFAEGTAAVPHGGTLKIKAGASSESGTVAKRVTIEAYGGPVTIGR